MLARRRSWWQKIKQHRVMTTIVVGIVIFIVVAYLLNWEWAGFNAVNSRIWKIGPPKTPSGTTIVQIEEQQQAKTLWDWLNLLGVLAIPVVVGFGAAWFTAKQARVSEAENKDNQREKALQDYIDKMSELLLHEELRHSTEEHEVRKLARVRTITVLTQLDTRRIGYVFAFLREAGLMSTKPKDNVVSLKNADLRALKWGQTDLREANLSGANLSETDLSKDNLSGADLNGANLSETLQLHLLPQQ